MAALRITAVLPVFNGAKFVDDAVDSIVAQTRLPDEILIVDDGSTDDSAAVIAALVERVNSPTISVITQENAGQSAARNTGVSHATGDLIAFIDQDDKWYPEHLKVLTTGFDSQPGLGWTYSDFDEIDAESKLTTRAFLAAHHVSQPKSDVADYLAHDAMILPAASVVRTAALNSIGGFDPRLSGYEDDDLFLRLFRAGWDCRFEARTLSQFRVHGTSSSARSSFRLSREIYFDKLCAELPDDPRLSRYYVTDLLLPRIFTASLNDYVAALALHSDSDARAIAQSATRMARKSHVSGRRRLGLAVLRHPRVCRVFLVIIKALPRPLRPRLTPAFRLN